MTFVLKDHIHTPQLVDVTVGPVSRCPHDVVIAPQNGVDFESSTCHAYELDAVADVDAVD